jgi:hypothetical protein
MPNAESIAKARIDAMRETVRERIIDEFCARLDDIRQRLIYAFNDGLDKAVEKHLNPRKRKEIELDEEGCEEAEED